MSEEPWTVLCRAADCVQQRAAAAPMVGGLNPAEGNMAWLDWLRPFVNVDAVAPHLEAVLRAKADEWASEAARPFYAQGEFRREYWFSQILRQSPEYRLALALLGEEQA